MLLGPDQDRPFQYNKQVPILPFIHRVLSSEFEYVDFELILHALEQFEPGEVTDEKQMITSLAGEGFQEFRNYDHPGGAQEFQPCGALGLVPSGFPVSQQAKAEIVEFLGRG